MTPELVEYYRLMLLVGIRDKFDVAFDYALETEEPLSELVLALCTCISDNNQVLSVLLNHTLNYKIDEHSVCKLIFEDLLTRHLTGKMTRADVANTLYRIVSSINKFSDDPWYNLTETYYDLELYEDGIVSEEVFNQCFDAWFFQGKKLDVWALQREMNKE